MTIATDAGNGNSYGYGYGNGNGIIWMDACDWKTAIRIANKLTKCQLLLFIVISYLRVQDFYCWGKTCCSAYARNQECKRHIVFMNRITNKYLFGCLLYFRCAIALNFMNSRHKSVLLEWSTAGIVHGASLLWSHYSMFYNRIDLNYIPWVLIVRYVRANSNHYWNSLVDASNINQFNFSQFGHSIEFNLQTFFPSRHVNAFALKIY